MHSQNITIIKECDLDQDLSSNSENQIKESVYTKGIRITNPDFESTEKNGLKTSMNSGCFTSKKSKISSNKVFDQKKNPVLDESQQYESQISEFFTLADNCD